MSPIASVAQWLDAHVTLEAISGSISSNTHYYTLSPPFCKKYIRKKKVIKKKKSFELRDDLIPFKGTQATWYLLLSSVSHLKKNDPKRNHKKKNVELRDDLISLQGTQTAQYLSLSSVTSKEEGLPIQLEGFFKGHQYAFEIPFNGKRCLRSINCSLHNARRTLWQKMTTAKNQE